MQAGLESWRTIANELGEQPEAYRIGDALEAWEQHAQARTASPSPASQALLEERRQLVDAWTALTTRARNQQQLAQALDRYLFGKSLFLQRLCQGPGTNPGLVKFRRFFDNGKQLQPAVTSGEQWRAMRPLLYFAAESPILRHIELRIAPLRAEPVRPELPHLRQGGSRSVVTAYEHFFACWRSWLASDTFLSARTDLSFSFVIHFIRPENDARSLEDPIIFDRFRRELDAQSSALHRFLVSGSENASLVVGIDVANVERDAPIDVIAPYIRLLRGDEDSLAALVQSDRQSEYLNGWADLVEAGLHRPLPQRPRLGLTVHAGEDYYHPLAGLKAIRDTINFCRMTRGDRIGHGLALGADIETFNAEFGKSAVMPQGQALDLCVWLDRRLGSLGDVDRRSHRLLEDAIERLAREVYVSPVPRAQALYEVIRRRDRVPRRPAAPGIGLEQNNRAGQDQDVTELRWRNVADSEVRRRRAEFVTVPPELSEAVVERDLLKLQRAIIDEVARDQIVLEINPSSNLAVGGFGSIQQHPFMRIRQINKSITMTLNCDDPGTFATRIENEYAQVKRCLEQAGLDRHDVEAALAACAKAARQWSFDRSWCR